MNPATPLPDQRSTSRRSFAILAVGLILLIPVNFAAGAFNEEPTGSVADSLLAPPGEDGIWIVGNSIFRTAVDPVQLESTLTHQRIDFEYHGGHYTSLWYLIARNALPDVADRPSLLVWGFRPVYAALPAFRLNKVNDTEIFIVDGDPTYESLAEGISPPSNNGLDQLASEVDESVSATSLFGVRGRAAANLSSGSLDAGIALADRLGSVAADLVRREVVNGDATLLDVLNRVVTGGEVQLAEERVIDGVGDFIRGDPADYDNSFIPLIADQIASQDVPQLVVIWPPLSVAEERPDPAQDAFVADAIADLEDRGIPVLNLYADPRIGVELYADGDHFNPEGRDLITGILSDFLLDLGYS